jgi:hypothetical protein
MYLAGIPPTITLSGTFFVTTEFAPTIEFFPTVMPGLITTPIPSQHPSFKTTFLAFGSG